MFVGYVDNQLLFATSQPKGKEIISGTLTDEINSVSALEFTLPPSNDMAGQITPHASIIRLESDGTEIFRGAANSVSKNFRGDTVVSCDGMIALMADVIKDPFTASSYEIEGYVAAIVKNYNDGVTADRAIKVGQIAGFEGQTFSVSHSTECKNIFELLKELRSEKGGYIWASYIGGDVYINYTSTIGRRNSQQIAFGSNLVNIEDQLEVGTLVTRVWPLGNEGLTIASVNDGKAYLQNTDVELRYGRVDKTIQVDSDDPAVVKSYGQAYLTRYAAMNNTITLTAIDLHHLDKTISSFEVGDAVRVLSPPHGIDAEMIVNSVSTDLVQLSNSRITLGAKKGSITSIISSGGGSGTPGGSSTGGGSGGGGGGGVSIVVDSALSLTSTNPVENKVITAALNGKAGTAAATQLAAGLMSAADKTKLDGIAKGATKITVDSELSSTSTNPVQNKAVKSALDAKAEKTALDGKLDVTGGTIFGDLKVKKNAEGTGNIDVEGEIRAQNSMARLREVYATNIVHSDAMVEAPSFNLRAPLAEKSIEVTQDGDTAVKMECFDGTLSKGYARLKIGTPTEDDDATPKAYVDSKVVTGGGVIVDTAMSSTSTNPVQNKVIKQYVDSAIAVAINSAY